MIAKTCPPVNAASIGAPIEKKTLRTLLARLSRVPILRNRRGAEYVQFIALMFLFVLVAFVAITALGDAVVKKFGEAKTQVEGMKGGGAAK